MKWATTWSAILVGSLSACAPNVPPVAVVGSTPKRPCETLGRVEGKGTSSAKARMELRKEAGRLGADTVVIDEPTDLQPGRRVALRGVALRCGGGPAEAQAPSTAAEASEEKAAKAEGEPAAPASASLEERLRTLKELHEEGLITDEDYDTRRKQLLEEL